MKEGKFTSSKVIPRLPRGWWFKVHGGPMQRSGVPDLIGCVRGRFVGIEVKNPENDRGLTPQQRLHLERIRSNGGAAMTIRTIAELDDCLIELPNGLLVPRFSVDDDPQDFPAL